MAAGVTEKRLLHHRLDIRPGIGPEGLDGLPQGIGQARAEDRAVGIVEEELHLRPPQQVQALRGLKHLAQGTAQQAGPAFTRAHRGLRPVEATDCSTDLAAAGGLGRCTTRWGSSHEHITEKEKGNTAIQWPAQDN